VKQKINMHAGTLEWNGSDLSGIGKPRLRITRSADPPAPGIATRMLVTLTVTVDLEALDPGTIQARAQWLADSMRVPEGILRSGSGSGHTVEWLCVPGDHTLSEALTGRSNSVDLTFSCVENHGDAALAGLTGANFSPVGGAATVALHAIRDIKEDIRTTRHSERNSARSVTTTTLGFTARVAQANTADPLATRLAYLQAQAQIVKGLDTREGVLVLGSTNKIVRVTEFSPEIDERAGVLDVRTSCYYLTLPDVGRAECVHDTDTRLDEGSGEEVISVRGTIEAESRAIALAKLDALRTSQIAGGKRLVSYATQDKTVDGADSALSGNDWSGALTYSMELRKARAGGGFYTLRISTRKDIRSGMRWTYSGTVSAVDSAAALATARSIAATATLQHPIMVSSEETLDLATGMDDAGTRNFLKLDFSYEFEGASDGFLSGEITTENTRPLAGEWRHTLSGFLIATSRDAAQIRLDTLLAANGPDAVESTLRWTDLYLDTSGADSSPKTLCAKLEFTCSVRVQRSRTVVEYTETTEWDVNSMQQTRSVSGTVWASSEIVAEAAISSIIAGNTRGSRSHSKVLIDGNRTQWLKMDFSQSSTTRMAGSAAYDLREASSSITTTAAYQATVVTPIPFGTPVIQNNVGLVPGRKSATASAKAANSGTASAWVSAALGKVAGAYIVEPLTISAGTEVQRTGNTALDETLYTASGSVAYGI
jgi:hypothetical protein